MLNIAMIQMQVLLGQVEENYKKAEHLMLKAVKEGAKVLVLPEMWNTGFFPKDNLSAFVDVEGHRTQAFLSSFAKEHGVYIVGGSVSISRGDKHYNTTYIVDANGEVISSYDKVHTFSFAGEEQYFASGDHTHRFEIEGICCSSSICYDLRFPELFRKETVQGVDIWFLPAEWPDVRLVHWRTLLRARAIENQMFVCAVNACGPMGAVRNGGHSTCIDPWGEVFEELGFEEEVRIVSIDMEGIREIRERMNVFRDRREDVYNKDIC